MEMTTINPTPKVNGTYGAPMGRHTGSNYLETCAGKLYLKHIPLNNGGYDAGGAYWGHSQRLYFVQDQDGNSHFFRASNRDDAKRIISEEWEGATFYK